MFNYLNFVACCVLGFLLQESVLHADSSRLRRVGKNKRIHIVKTSLKASENRPNSAISEILDNTPLQGDESKVIASSPEETSNWSKFSSFVTLKWYPLLLESHPLLTKIVTASLIGALGDFLVQQIQRRQADGVFKSIDYRRIAVFSSVASLYEKFTSRIHLNNSVKHF